MNVMLHKYSFQTLNITNVQKDQHHVGNNKLTLNIL